MRAKAAARSGGFARGRARARAGVGSRARAVGASPRARALRAIMRAAGGRARDAQLGVARVRHGCCARAWHCPPHQHPRQSKGFSSSSESSAPVSRAPCAAEGTHFGHRWVSEVQRLRAPCKTLSHALAAPFAAPHWPQRRLGRRPSSAPAAPQHRPSGAVPCGDARAAPKRPSSASAALKRRPGGQQRPSPAAP